MVEVNHQEQLQKQTDTWPSTSFFMRTSLFLLGLTP